MDNFGGRDELKSIIVPAILATDMAKHRETVGNYRNIANDFDKSDKNNR